MSPGASVAFQYLRVRNPCEENGTVMKDSNSLEFGPGKHQAKQRLMQDMSPIKPQMMLKLLSFNMLSEDKKADFAQTKGFHTQSDASRHAEMIDLFPLSTSFGSNPRLIESNISLPSEIGLTNPNSSQCVVAELSEKPSSAQLTIFYKGAVNVYDMHADKVQDIMKLASSNSSSDITTSTITSGKIEQISQQQPTVDMEIMKKLSLKRFLQKQKERFNTVAPYTPWRG